MRLLLDTNALIWWMEDEPMLGTRSRELLANPDHSILVTMVSIWEITVKWRTGKFPQPGSAYLDFVEAEDVNVIGVTMKHLEVLEGLEQHHRDPFDHLILAQAKAEGAAIITSDREMTQYGVRCFPAGR